MHALRAHGRAIRAPVLKALCVWRYRLIKFLTILIVSAFLIPSAFAEEYKPIFQLDLPVQLENTLLNSYKSASQSSNINMATEAWKRFLAEYSYDDPSEVGDLTALIFIRQAHFELARLYYIKGNVVGGDSIIKKINDFNIYTSPEINNGKKWCDLEGYCQ